MSICPKCGANNKPTQEVCRLCATPLDRQGEQPSPRMIDSLAATVVAQDQAFHQSDQPGEIPCPTCQTMNERSWAFCQHCGSKLRQDTAPVTPNPPETLQRAPETVVVPSIRDNFAPPNPPVQTPTAPVEPPTVVPPQRPQPQQPPPSFDMRPAPVAPPPAPEPQTVVPPQPPPQRVSPPPQPAEQPQPFQNAANIAANIPGATPCPQCGHMNAPGSAFCGGCGSPMTVARTIVMSSVQATPKGRLHLIMEGGQQGEVYELKDETVIGRTMGDISFPHDGFMSSRHARIVQRGDTFILTDEGSRNGTFIKIKAEVELKPGDMILIGKQLFRFEV
ncbi:MAG TPA: zinc ribbon domain-containing protein [Blastocatellia bacterium]|nr:zinc ribbon domain-containing protein [Blastocatellia bacterium]